MTDNYSSFAVLATNPDPAANFPFFTGGGNHTTGLPQLFATQQLAEDYAKSVRRVNPEYRVWVAKVRVMVEEVPDGAETAKDAKGKGKK